MNGSSEQLEFFAPIHGVTILRAPEAPTSRNTDPETSHAAGELPGRDTDRWRALEALIGAGVCGLTDFELAERIGRQQTSAGKRRLELQRKGLVRDSGHTRPAPSGAQAIVWVATAANVAA